MRVTNASTYRNYTSQVNSVHLNLNKSLNKISSGKAYEAASDSPLSYYRGKEIDTQYREVLSKSKLLKNVQNRLYQQELGARDIQERLSTARKEVIKARNATTTDTAKKTIRDELLQLEHTMVNDLNSQYQDFYVYGGNDVTTTPFELSSDGKTLTYRHKFPGESTAKEFIMKLTDENQDGNYAFKFDAANSTGTEAELIKAMSEQGFMDLGYGNIRDHSTLLDTYTGGMNLLSGYTSDAIIESNGTITTNDIMKGLTDGPLGLVAQAVSALDDYIDGKEIDPNEGHIANLGRVLDQMTEAEHKTSTVYSDLGNKSNLLDSLAEKLGNMEDSLEEQYKDILGADPYASILEMYGNQYAYNAALQVGSKLMSNSLFDFVR
ncbi:MAG: flagellar hook-basal body protein [Lachnospiraceae bacterium]|nr:flagellar hook-basal body protein [Lachnospiraceae bacterium]